MKKVIALALSLTLTASMIGCGNAPQNTTPPAALAPGYGSADDEKLGKDLSAMVSFVNQEKENYAKLTATQQAAEKPYLNGFIDAVDIANVSYTAFHAGTQTLAQAQSAYNQAQIAETNLTSHAGVK